MVPFNKTLAALVLGLAVAVGVSPALAQGRADDSGDGSITAARASALRACTARESKDVEYNWGVQAIEIYRSCMAEHGQME